jgi:hypothetical protein
VRESKTGVWIVDGDVAVDITIVDRNQDGESDDVADGDGGPPPAS